LACAARLLIYFSTSQLKLVSTKPLLTGRI